VCFNLFLLLSFHERYTPFALIDAPVRVGDGMWQRRGNWLKKNKKKGRQDFVWHFLLLILPTTTSFNLCMQQHHHEKWGKKEGVSDTMSLEG